MDERWKTGRDVATDERKVGWGSGKDEKDYMDIPRFACYTFVARRNELGPLIRAPAPHSRSD